MADQSTEGLSAPVAWVQSMPRSALPTPKANEQPKLNAQLNYEEQVNQLNAQAELFRTAVNELQAAVARLDLRSRVRAQENRPISNDDNKPSELRKSSSTAYVRALLALQELSGGELQQILEFFGIDWVGVRGEDMKRTLSKRLGLHLPNDLPTY